METVYIPKLKKTDEFINENMKEMEMVKEIVRKFDEDICDKASRS